MTMRFAPMPRLVAIALFAGVAGVAGAAPSCPVTDGDVEKSGSYVEAVRAAMRAAPDCPGAYALFEGCQLGSSADNELSGFVEAKCEPLFLPAANATIKAAYRKALAACDRIAERNAGTLYQSMAAVCRAGAARDFAARRGRK